ncbi:unnamed protein product [Effrenium voratum]|uniref:Uncharacterized protein n=1 Tax=Effrenium voratum TaxID=2562239 RepID=A0AA36J8Z8_9DINO|nr:unnamed protein product [Effrenium voratum]
MREVGFVIELLRQDTMIFPRLSVVSLQSRRLRPLPPLPPYTLESLAQQAVKVAEEIRSYGLLGSNCQHYVKDLLKTLTAHESGLRTDDRKAVKGLQAVTAATCVATGTVRAVAAVAVGGGLAAAGHLVFGSLLAFGLARGLSKSYKLLYKRQHNSE